MNKLVATVGVIVVAGALVAGYFVLGQEDESQSAVSQNATEAVDTVASEESTQTTEQAVSEEFTIDVWADNWFQLYVNGVKVGEDSVPITTERSFNKETFSFTATRPMTIAIEAKDFKETDSGIEYIGASNQQMGDGGLIAQVRDASGNIVAVTDASWSSFVTHKAPLDKSCEKSSDPDSECEFEITMTPAEWYGVGYDDSGWVAANEYTESEVSPKQGYDEVSWDSSAALIWGTDLEQDNTILFRSTVQ